VKALGNTSLADQILTVWAPGNGTLYTPQNVTFVADSSMTTLSFADVSLTSDCVDLLLDNVRLAAQDAPVIITQPASQAVVAGQSVTLSVTACGAAPLSYQWRFNGHPTSGATASVCTISSAQSSDAGNYDVVISNGLGSVTSATAVLTVVSAGSLVNGSFEDGYNGWTTAGNQSILTSTAGLPATDGTKAVLFNAAQRTPNGALGQTVATISGQAYTLSFDLGAFSLVNRNAQQMHVTVRGSSTLLDQVRTVSAPGSGTLYTPQSVGFVADSALATLTFTDVSLTTDCVDLLLDNVRLAVQQGPINAAPLANGSFEADYNNWTATGNQSILTGSPGLPATEGAKAVLFNAGQRSPNGLLTQTISTTAGRSYTLSFDLGAFSLVTRSAQRMRVTLRGSSTLLDQILTVSAPGTGTLYVPQSLSFRADGATAILSFTDVSLTTDCVDMLLDNVRVSDGNAGAGTLAYPMEEGTGEETSQVQAKVSSVDNAPSPVAAFKTITGVLFRWSGLEPGTYQLQTSGDLLSWRALDPDVLVSGPIFEHHGTIADSDYEFYRLIRSRAIVSDPLPSR
jgi:hypothetical protein